MRPHIIQVPDINQIRTLLKELPVVGRGVKNTYYSRRPLEAKVWWGRFLKLLELAGPLRPNVALDLGTGYGLLLPSLATWAADVLAIDLDPNHVTFSKRLARILKLENIHVVAADAAHLPFRNNSADFIVAADVLEHLTGLVECLREMDRVISVSGKCVISFPSESPFYLILRWLRKRTFRENTHISSSRQVFQTIRQELLVLRHEYYPRPFDFFFAILCVKRTPQAKLRNT